MKKILLPILLLGAMGSVLAEDEAEKVGMMKKVCNKTGVTWVWNHSMGAAIQKTKDHPVWAASLLTVAAVGVYVYNSKSAQKKLGLR